MRKNEFIEIRNQGCYKCGSIVETTKCIQKEIIIPWVCICKKCYNDTLSNYEERIKSLEENKR